MITRRRALKFTISGVNTPLMSWAHNRQIFTTLWFWSRQCDDIVENVVKKSDLLPFVNRGITLPPFLQFDIMEYLDFETHRTILERYAMDTGETAILDQLVFMLDCIGLSELLTKRINIRNVTCQRLLGILADTNTHIGKVMNIMRSTIFTEGIVNINPLFRGVYKENTLLHRAAIEIAQYRLVTFEVEGNIPGHRLANILTEKKYFLKILTSRHPIVRFAVTTPKYLLGDKDVVRQLAKNHLLRGRLFMNNQPIILLVDEALRRDGAFFDEIIGLDPQILE